jgi:hypothetical protein
MIAPILHGLDLNVVENKTINYRTTVLKISALIGSSAK